ncbi:MAG TPA: class I SAM-dependent methyltransferase [Nitrospirae bacterium]|nr:putative methyltransferase YrrT [bacterium BMS3Abin06]HDH11732.1 class I SAM-dependent methyltransferase [Nitrospirota bacterium]HDZ02568.1 class I SAM-dependent methyltransferase [Nitrospirota bacterium]
MTEFNKSRWANAEFSQEYRDNADIFIVERRRLLEVMKSFYRYFILSNENNNILDLGCGDGIITLNLLEIDKSISATLIDASDDMLNKASDRLSGFENINFIKASFQEILEKDILHGNFDFAVSSLAIHHLTMNEKRDFFKEIYSHLHAGGYFMNIDVMLAPTDTLEQWYMQMWREWIDETKTSLGIEGNIFDDITRRYKEFDDNKPDTLDDQLNALRDIGFKEVDCFYKYGVFAVYGGRK